MALATFWPEGTFIVRLRRAVGEVVGGVHEPAGCSQRVRAPRIIEVPSANGGSVGNRRPNLPWS